MFKPVESHINFPDMEKKWLAHWYKKGVVQAYLRKNKAAKDTFSFLDGPITANNPMGIHHAWGRTYKDLWQKFHNLLGKRQRFQNGFDCQGLWVEVEVEKELGLKNKKEIEHLIPGDKKGSIARFVELCKKRVVHFSGIQTEQTKRLGNFMDWDHSYYTMSDENNYMIWHFLKVCYENGWIYKGHESVPWCPRCETAISQHEMLTEDYKTITHKSVYFALPIVGRKKEYLLVWTTTPWTLPANIAVAVDQNMDYLLVKGENNNAYWIVKGREQIISDSPHVVKQVKGKELVGLAYRWVFDSLSKVKKTAVENPKKFHIVIATDPQIMPITTTEGTGLVHTAVSAGTEDFQMGKKLGLPLIPVIGDNADYLPDLDFLSGKNAKKHPEVILDYMVQQSTDETPWVFKIENYTHRYPACWRCKTELVWKVADEWYIAMDRKSKTLRQRMIAVAKKIAWMPEFGLDRELDWLKNMHDWLISKKNRYWGLALPIYECKECGSFEVIGSKEELRQRAVEGWTAFEGRSPHKPYIDEVKIRCAACGQIVSRIDDVGNPWLDAGIVPYSTIAEKNQGTPLYLKDKNIWKEWFPVDFITESFPGQFKNWFYALIAESTVLEDAPPFKRVLGFGTLLGEDGRPMHKSWGNAIEFGEGADKIGVDVIRWMFVRHNPSENMLFGYKHADEVRRTFYLILWNVYKFFMQYAVLDRFIPTHGVPHTDSVLDVWILSRLSDLSSNAHLFMSSFNAKDAAHEVERFVDDLSTWYLRRSRERVWVSAESEQDKQSFYETMHYVLVNLSIILSPFMPFISEEMYTNLTGKESVHLADWPTISEKLRDEKLEKEMNVGRKVVEIGHAIRKEKKIKLRQPLSAAWHNENKSGLTNINIMHILKRELNVETINDRTYDFHTFIKKPSVVSKEIEGVTVAIDTHITPELKEKGELRELIRTIQELRKAQNVTVSQTIHLTVPSKFARHAEEIKKKVLAKSIQFGSELRVSI